MTKDELHEAILLAHEQENQEALVEHYQRAYALELDTDPDASYFFLTNAYVFALDINHPDADSIGETLRQANRL